MKFLFTKENAYALVRTAATFVYGWLLTLAPWVEDVINDIGISPEFFVLLFGAVLYQLVRVVAEKVPWVGYFLVINKKPDYDVAA